MSNRVMGAGLKADEKTPLTVIAHRIEMHFLMLQNKYFCTFQRNIVFLNIHKNYFAQILNILYTH